MKPSPDQSSHSPAPVEPPAPADERRRLDRSLLGGVAWTAGSKWAVQMLSWGVTLVIARLLTPADFGLVGMATVYLGLVTLLSEFGFGTAVVTLRNLNQDQLKQINTLAVAFGVVGALFSFALAVPVGGFFHSPKLPMVIVVMSLAFILTAFQSVPYALLSRDLNFRLLAGINTAAAVSQAVASLVLALLGYGYWSLVLGSLVGAAVTSVLPIIHAPCGFARPRARSVGHVMRFSWHVIVSRAAWYGYSNADFVVAGRLLGEAPLGAYTLAWNLASMPVEKITNMLTSVTPPFFSAVQTQPMELRRYLVRMSEALAMVTFPATLGLALVAPEFVRVVLGPKWLASIAPLELLALYASLRSIVTLLPQVLIAVGETRFVMWSNLAMLAVLPLVFYQGGRWGATGIAAGWVAVYPLLTLPLYHRTFRIIGLSVGDYLGGLWPALSSSAVMCAAVLLLKWAVPPSLPVYARLALEVLAGSGVYVGMLAGAHRERAFGLVRMGLSLRR